MPETRSSNHYVVSILNRRMFLHYLGKLKPTKYCIFT